MKNSKTHTNESRHTRRSFLGASGAAAAAPFLSRFSRASSAAKRFNPSFGTASEALKALQGGVISSRELTDHVFQRIKRHNPKINAFVTLLEEQAFEQARRADELLVRRRSPGKLHGLPILVKDAFATAGVRTTCGSKSLVDYVPQKDAIAVARLRQAGAIIVGKTNVPEFASDVQSYNSIAGTSNNPWDLARTPGGSTGGGAAALAAGFGFLEIGSDIGGSIRTPAHFCGVYGHKPTLDLVPYEGHIPPSPGMLIPGNLSVVGPLARSAEDLLLELDVIGGSAPAEAIALRWSLPKARKTSLREYKIGFVLDDPFCPVDSAVRDVASEAVASLRKAGVQTTEGWPAGVDPKANYHNYLFLLAAIITAEQPQAAVQEMIRTAESGVSDPFLRGTTADHREWLHQEHLRLTARNPWCDYFKTFDAFILPANFVSAFPHDHSDPTARTLMANGTVRRYEDVLSWISFATLTGCPATVAPVGRTRSGLPVGLQIIGPFLEDATPIDIALKMADVCGAFTPPPDFSD